jgi:hypothetical protein
MLIATAVARAPLVACLHLDCEHCWHVEFTDAGLMTGAPTPCRCETHAPTRRQA